MSDTQGPASRSDREDKVHRRGFFTEGFRNLFRPLADMMEERLKAVEVPEWAAEESDVSSTYRSAEQVESPPPSPLVDYLRPPGALPEEEFLVRCSSTGHCVQACPVSAIRLVWTGTGRYNGKPAIEPSSQACVLCPDLSCMKACPTGALRLVPREEIRIGLAALRHASCLRTLGEDCRLCVDKCPVGSRALRLPSAEGDPIVDATACTGCGVCEMVCPAQPKAIVVEKLRGG